MGRRTLPAALALLLSFQACCGEYSSAALSLHIDALLAEYDREAPPARPVAVAVALDVRQVSVEGDHMLLLADLKMQWQDSRLVWNASQWEGDSVLVGGERLWTPDVALRSAGRGAGGARAGRARAATGGRVSLVQRLQLRAPIALQLRAWPRDAQEAAFVFASRSYTLDDLDLQPYVNKSNLLTESGWTLQDVRCERVTWRSAEGAQEGGAAFTVRAARRGAALAAAAGAVLAAALLLLAAALARPYDARAPLAGASALVSALWLVSVMVVLPGGESTPHAVRVACGACCAAALAALAAALAHALARRAAAPPPALRALLSKLSALHSIAPDTAQAARRGRGAWAAPAAALDAALSALLALAVCLMLLVYLLL